MSELSFQAKRVTAALAVGIVPGAVCAEVVIAGLQLLAKDPETRPWVAAAAEGPFVVSPIVAVRLTCIGLWTLWAFTSIHRHETGPPLDRSDGPAGAERR